MYAMLVGSLPFTVEPFNIKALHKKMLNGEINPIPAHLSTRTLRVFNDYFGSMWMNSKGTPWYLSS